MTNRLSGTPRMSQMAWKLVFMSSLVPQIRCARPFFRNPTGRAQARLQAGGVDHHGVLFAMFGTQNGHNPAEDAFVALPLPTETKRPARATGEMRVAPSQPVAVNPDNATQYTSAINVLLDVALGEKGSRHAICASVSWKNQTWALFDLRTVNHTDERKSVGPDVRRLNRPLLRIHGRATDQKNIGN